MLGEAFRDDTRYQTYLFIFAMSCTRDGSSFSFGFTLEVEFQRLEFLRYPIPLSSSIMVVSFSSFFVCFHFYTRRINSVVEVRGQ